MDPIVDFLVIHWPFAAAVAVFAVMGEVAKRAIAPRAKSASGWRSWFRKTMPLHPVLGGALLGLVPGIPASVEGASSVAARCLYYALAGACSTWAYSVARQLLRKGGIELPASGESTPPPSEPS